MDFSAVEQFLCHPNTWISGQYIYAKGVPTFIVAQTTPELVDVTYYMYSYWPMMTDESFEPFSRFIWPVGAESIFQYVSLDIGGLSFDGAVKDKHFLDLTMDLDPRDITPMDAALMICPLMEKLVVFDSSMRLPRGAVEDFEKFEPIWKVFEGRESPDFWINLTTVR